MIDLIRALLGIRPYLSRKQKQLFLLTILLGIGWFVVELLFALVLQGFLVSIGLFELAKATLPFWYPSGAGQTILLLLLCGALRAFLIWMRSYAINRSNSHILSEIRRRILGISLFQASNLSTEESLTAFGETANQTGFFFQNFALFVISGITSISLLTYGLYLSWKLMLVSFVAMAIFALPLKRLSRAFDSRGKALVNKLGFINGVLITGIRNHFLLNLYGRTESEVEKGEKLILDYEKTQRDYYMLHGIIGALPNMVGVIVISTVTWFNIRNQYESGAVLLSFLYVFLRFSQSWSDSNTAYSYMIFNRRFVVLLVDLFSGFAKMKNKLPLSSSDFRVVDFSSAAQIGIKFNAVSFGYQSENKIFADMNLEIKTGEMLVIKGPSGAGKSTFLRLLTGFLLPQSGNVSVNGTGVHLHRKQFSEIVSYVGPDPFIIPDTLRANLLYAHPNPNRINDGEMLQLLVRLDLAQDFKRSGLSLDTKLLEDSQISTGQRQRLAFARAILRSPRLLILDEATANLDDKSEKIILDWLVELKPSTCQVVVTHKSTFDPLADKTLDLTAKEFRLT